LQALEATGFAHVVFNGNDKGDASSSASASSTEED
jgi:hypothetical protein